MRNFIFLIALFCVSCNETKAPNSTVSQVEPRKSGVELVVLGTVQDGGAPHIGCVKSCCEKLWENPDKSLKVVSLGIVDHDYDQTFILEATPDFPEQLAHLNEVAGRPMSQMPDGIFITHAHIGHYAGLMYLGREAKGAKDVPVFTMPRFNEFLKTNGPWNQLVDLNNIRLNYIEDGSSVLLTRNLSVSTFTVPHRDEYSETVGFVVKGPQQKILFIPDIDKWSKWEDDIIEKVEEVDLAFLDATFYDAKEINNRDISEIPHPFVIESMQLFDALPDSEKQKVHFIHLNHTNPLLDRSSEPFNLVISKNYNVAEFGNKRKI